MSDERKFYCICENNCRFETMTKEQILAAIAQAVETGSVGNCDTGFISKVKEQNGGSCVTFWVGTQAEYNSIMPKEKNCLYIITDDTTTEEIKKACSMATMAAEEARQIDVSKEVSLSWVVGAGGANLSELYVDAKQYIYSHALGVVFYKIGLSYNGKLEENEVVTFNHAGGYAPSSHVVSFPAACYGNYSQQDFQAAYNGRTLYVKSMAGCDTRGELKAISISGWYFCNGK